MADRDTSALLMSRVCDALTAKLEGLDWKIGSLPAVERTVLAAIHARGVIGSGGLRYFYERHHEIAPVAEAFETLGYAEAAVACRESAKVFPGGIVPTDDVVRDDFLERNVDRNETVWEPLVRKVWAIDYGELNQRLANYV